MRFLVFVLFLPLCTSLPHVPAVDIVWDISSVYSQARSSSIYLLISLFPSISPFPSISHRFLPCFMHYPCNISSVNLVAGRSLPILRSLSPILVTTLVRLFARSRPNFRTVHPWLVVRSRVEWELVRPMLLSYSAKQYVNTQTLSLKVHVSCIHVYYKSAKNATSRRIRWSLMRDQRSCIC